MDFNDTIIIYPASSLNPEYKDGDSLDLRLHFFPPVSFESGSPKNKMVTSLLISSGVRQRNVTVAHLRFCQILG